MPKFEFTSPEGKKYEVEGPQGATKEQAFEMLQTQLSSATKPSQPAPKQPGFGERVKENFIDSGKTAMDTVSGLGAGVGQVGLGAQHYLGKYATAIGADTVGNWLTDDAKQGREKLKRELAPHKARSPVATGAGEIGGNVVATLPVGGAFAKVPKLLAKAPMLASQATKLNAAATALRTGGFSTGLPAATTTAGKVGQMALRMGGGAAVGGASAGLVDPEQAGTGALIGALLPPGIKAAGELGKLAKRGASSAVSNTLGATTGTGAESVRAAYHAGKNKSTAFLDNMRGNVPFDDVVNQAKGALNTMRIERGNAYRSGMVDIANDRAVVDFKPISDAVSRVSKMGSYKGQQINKNASGTVNELTETVNKWSRLNPAEYHTPEGLDALKQSIGDIRDTTQFGTAARRAADTAYNAVKDQITAQAPTYAKVMKDYSEASTALQEAEKALSLGNKASADTAIRKLQSLMRNNAQTSYGNRLNIAKNLENKGGVELLPAIAGQSMNAVMPRGITGAIQKGGALLTAAGTGGASIVPTMLAAPFTSPRLMGEALYGIGRMNGATGSLLNTGKLTAEQLAQKYPGLLSAPSAFYKSVPVMATSTNR